MTIPSVDPNAERERVVQECWRRAIHSFGTAAVFDRRARKYRWRVRIPAFLGIAVPAVVGTMALSWGAGTAGLTAVLWTAGILGVVQVVLSVWSLVAGWDSGLAYALESSTENRRLAAQFEKLARTPLSDPQLRFDLLDTSYQARSDADVKQVFSDYETKFGLRSGLQRFQRPCVECKKVPIPNKPSACPVCGK